MQNNSCKNCSDLDPLDVEDDINCLLGLRRHNFGKDKLGTLEEPSAEKNVDVSFC